MSLLDSLTKKKKLTAAINQTAKARSSEGRTADELYKSAYHDYAEVLVGDNLRAEALYNWGFALLHQARTKTGKEAEVLYREAIAKFSFCLLLNPSYLAAAADGGVAYMDLARLKAVTAYDELYELAKSCFETANGIQAGSASYNLACIYGLRNDGKACLQALETARDKGFLPTADEVQHDVDLDRVKQQPWFVEFIASLELEPAAAVKTEAEPVEATELETVAETQATEAVSVAPVTESENENKPE
jgi:hypothetical protein